MNAKTSRKTPDSALFGADVSSLASVKARGLVSVSLLTESVDEYIFEMEFRGQSPRTLEGKRDLLLKFLWWMERESLQSCGKLEVKKFLHYVANAHDAPCGRWDRGLRGDGSRDERSFKAVGERTIQLYFVYLKHFFDYLASEEIIAASPLLGMKQPAAPKKSPRPLDVQTDVVAMIHAAQRGRAPKRDVALLYFLLDTGVRASELCGIDAGDIDWVRGVVAVTGKGNKVREVSFERDCSRILKNYLKAWPCDLESPLFRSEGGHTPGERLTREGVLKIVKRMATRAGITGKQVSPHVFRHTFGTEMAKGNAHPRALQMLMGHTTLDMTMKYVTLAEADTKNQHRMASPARLLRTSKKDDQKGKAKRA